MRDELYCMTCDKWIAAEAEYLHEQEGCEVVGVEEDEVACPECESTTEIQLTDDGWFCFDCRQAFAEPMETANGWDRE